MTSEAKALSFANFCGTAEAVPFPIMPSEPAG